MSEHRMEKTALILEGGGMRATYSAGILAVLIEKGLWFPYITGISAGTTLLVNYVLRDVPRLRASFIDAAKDPNFAGMKHFIKGHGFFNAHYMYEEMIYDDGALAVDWQAWEKSDVEICIGAYNQDKGTMKYWHRDEVKSLRDLGRICRASSSLPILMPPTYIDGEGYVDGGVVDSFGIEEAKRDGYEKFVIIPTHTRGFRREPAKENLVYKKILRHHPKVYEAMMARSLHYNASMAEIERLESTGQALVLYPEEMPLTRTERDEAALIAGYNAGKLQAEKSFDEWFPSLAE